MTIYSWRKSPQQASKGRSSRSARVESLKAIVESLESRQLLASSVLIDAVDVLGFVGTAANNNLSVSYDTPTDTYTISDSADTIDVVNLGTASVTGSGTNSIQVSGIVGQVYDLAGGDDTFTVATGTSLAADVDGGIGFDRLVVNAAGTLGPVVGGSTITFGGGEVLNYSNFEAVDVLSPTSTAPVVTANATLTAVEGTPLVDARVATFVSTNAALRADDFGATINWGDGTTTAGVITPDATNPTLYYVTGTHTFADEGTPALTVSVRALATTTTTLVNGVPVTVTTAPSPVASSGSTVAVADAGLSSQGVPVSAVEGTAFAGRTVATFTSSDPDATSADFTATISWGDGSTSAGTIVPNGTSPNGVTFSVTGGHTYVTEGEYSVVVSIASVGGSETVAGSTAFVSDGALSVLGVNVTATAGTPLANAVVANFTDLGGLEPAGSYTATVNWGDGQSATTGIVSLSGSTYTVTAGHTFVAPGSYTGTITVRSEGGSVSTVPFSATIVGLSATTLAVSATEDVALNNVPLIRLASNGGPAPLANFYSATIDWGDATSPTIGFVNSNLEVLGSHTYDEGGTYNVRIVVAAADNPNLLVFSRSLTVADVPIIITGQLDPSSDSGISNSDKITNDVQPLFTGTSEPLSNVTITATPSTGGAAIVLGSTTTDASGAWRLDSTVALADGTYTVTADAVDRNGATTASLSLGSITIDTVGPLVNRLTFGRNQGQVEVTLSDDRSGLAQRTLVDNANFSVSKPHLRPGRLLFTSLTASPAASPTSEQIVTGLINGGQRLRGSTYTFTVSSGGITDVAGNDLDGEFYGYFPSGNGKPGGDFVAIVDTFHNLIFPPKPSHSYGTPNVPPGQLGTGYIAQGRFLTPDLRVRNLFRGQTPGGSFATGRGTNLTRFSATPKAPKVTRAAALKLKAAKLSVSPADQVATAHAAAIAELANGGQVKG